MLVFLKQVGTNFGVIDTDDGVIDWVTKDQLLNYAKQISIKGVASNGLTKNVVSVNPAVCNWDKGANVFKTIKYLTISKSGEFIITTMGGKRLKGYVSSDMYLNFSFNVRVPLHQINYNLLAQGDSNAINNVIANFRAGHV